MIAEYIGGQEVLSQIAPDAVPGMSIPIFFIFSAILQIMVWLYKKLKGYKSKSIQNYVESLRQSLGKQKYYIYKIIFAFSFFS